MKKLDLVACILAFLVLVFALWSATQPVERQPTAYEKKVGEYFTLNTKPTADPLKGEFTTWEKEIERFEAEMKGETNPMDKYKVD